MKRNLFGWLAMAAMLVGTGCSSDEVVNDYSPENAIQFGTYVGRDAQGRASVFETADMKTDGFGVYAYCTGTTNWADYSQKNNPNFMNNTKVTYNTTDSKWVYSPVKYWPNNEGDKVTFFAYAPWQAGGTDDNIKLNANNAQIDFAVPNDVTEQTDLTWNSTAFMNLTKQTTDGLITFVFNHALARIGFTLQAAVDQIAAGGTIATGTTITLNQIILGTSSNGFYTEGTLDLTKSTATWLGSTLKGRQAFTLLPANFISGSNVLTGANAQANLIDEDGDDYIMIIPQKKENLQVYVEYTVHTEGADGSDSSIIENKITTTIDELDFEAGKAYTLNLVLGMTSVKLSASVNGWASGSSTVVNLPINTVTNP